jgi:small-conductance mechanosensitive channel
LDISIAYKEDVDQVMEHLVKLGEEMSQDPEWSPKLIGDMEVLGVDAFADSAVVIKVMFTTLPLNQWAVGREFRRRVKNHFDQVGIEIPFPTAPSTSKRGRAKAPPLLVRGQSESQAYKPGTA